MFKLRRMAILPSWCGLLRVIVWIWILSIPTEVSMKEIIRLGYITGSERSQGDFSYRKPGQLISGAITLAVDEINNNPNFLPNHTLEFIIAETYGNELHSIRQTAVLPSKNISAYIGPQETCVHEGRVAAAFNLPMTSYFCAKYEVSDRKLYPTFARTRPPDSQISTSVASLLKAFNWRKVVFIHSNKAPAIADTIHKLLWKHGINVTDRRDYEGPYFHLPGDNPFVKIVSETYTKTRVYVMLGEYYEFIGLMDSLQLRGLLDTGEYFVVGVHGVHRAQYDPTDPQKYLEGLFLKTPKNITIQAFRSYIGIAPAPPKYPWFKNFSAIVNNYLEAPPFNYTNPYREWGKLRQVRSEAAFLYDAVWLYARAAHKALLDGQAVNNGTAILSYMYGTTYESAMGYMNRINHQGDAEGNFTLLARKRSPDQLGEWGLFPVGTFYLNTNASELPVFKLHEGEIIDWVGGKPPVDEPPCGFLGERCIPVPSYTVQIVGGSIGGVLFITLVIGVIVYRNWRYEQELASLLWKIDIKDITIKETVTNLGTGPSKPLSSISRTLRVSTVSLTSQVDIDLKQIFTRVGRYKGSIVAIKKLNKKNIDLTRPLRKEMKMMRDIRHDNLNQFIGACVDPNNINIICEYCPKGSLEDILANEDVKLDNMFIASLLFDIIKGMTFLHDSEIRSHGRLKSSNCVVDSRWVLKITDYGLNEFRAGVEPDKDRGEHAYYESLLWTAPELLRMAEPPLNGTQKGDIYSFGIILYELHGRNGPFGDTDIPAKEIIQRVMVMEGDRFFRPRLAALDSTPKFVTDCIQDCWHEKPYCRPDFKTIRNRLKPMQKGLKANIFDNMMAIMEKYATNLEEIVEERTDQLREEKKKTEELLHQMLPRSVAEQLKQGKPVEAESFDSVTIYFSDICGFTSMSSESTPMQIIDLLNDLYTTFDSILENYDVYKVETIGDAYMVVSGLPKRNGIRHAGEIASMSLHLLSAIRKFKIRHRPTDVLKLRIGIHSGFCVAGVVGLKMPRFCLFGDTVNTASRMESNGLPLKIHCSPQTKDLLDQLGGYHIEERGLVSMKGKGEIRTYWVCGEDKERRMSRLAPPPYKSSKSPRAGDSRRGQEHSSSSSCPLPRAQCNRNSDSSSSASDGETECRETDTLLNGAIPNSNFCDATQVLPRRPEIKSLDLDILSPPTKKSKNSPVKITVNNDKCAAKKRSLCNSVSDAEDEEQEVWSRRPTRSATCSEYSHEGSPLLRFDTGSDTSCGAKSGRSSSAETPV